jgi:hypothetical protein
MRLYEIVMAATPKGGTWWAGDISWNWAWVPTWSQIEVDVGIVAASLPSLSPLLKHVWSGFATDRPMMPSQLPTLLAPDVKGPLQDLSPWSEEFGDTKEKELETWYNDARDSEDFDYEAFKGMKSSIEVVISRETEAPVGGAGSRRGLSGG